MKKILRSKTNDIITSTIVLLGLVCIITNTPIKGAYALTDLQRFDQGWTDAYNDCYVTSSISTSYLDSQLFLSHSYPYKNRYYKEADDCSDMYMPYYDYYSGNMVSFDDNRHYQFDPEPIQQHQVYLNDDSKRHNTQSYSNNGITMTKKPWILIQHNKILYRML